MLRLLVILVQLPTVTRMQSMILEKLQILLPNLETIQQGLPKIMQHLKKKESHIMRSQCRKGKTCSTSQGKLGKLLIQMVNVLYINDISLHNHNSYNHLLLIIPHIVQLPCSLAHPLYI
jgi:hypothetical protein